MNTLFELRTEKEIRAEAVAANDALIHAALMGRGAWELTERQRRLVELLRGRQGKLQPLSSAEIEARLGCDDRTVRREVRELVMTFRLPIVASRDVESNGYFFAVSAEERFAYTEQYVQEGRKLFERAAIVRNVFDIVELAGQRTIAPVAAGERESR